MIITQEQVTVQSNVRATDRKAMTLKVGPEIFQILIKTQYANPPLAALSEAGQNAFDSHKRAGNGDKPFVVHLPTHFDPRLVIRDYGVSMSHEFVMNDYCVAGQSSKSQDANQSGGFGIGRLSGLALSTTYNIACYQDGEKRTYSVYVNGDGVPEIRHVVTAKSEEPTGVEITIPVNEKDVPAFDHAAKEAYRFYDPKPIIRGIAGFVFHKNDVTLKGNQWFIDRSINFPVAVGGVYWYRIEPDNITGLTDEQRDLLNSSLGLVLDFGASELHPQSNRQGLLYNDVTCSAIKARLTTLEGEVKAVVQAHFDKCTTIIEAKRLWLDYFKPGGSAFQLGRVFGTKQVVSWQGHVIDNADLTILEVDPINPEKVRNIPGIALTCYTIRRGRRGHRSVTEDKLHGTIFVAAKSRLFLNDLDGGRGLKRRVGYELMQELDRTGDNYLAYFGLRFKTPAAEAAFHAVNHTTPADIVTYFTPASTIDVPATVSLGGDGNEKRKLKVFRFTGAHRGRREGPSVAWEPAEIDEDTGGVFTTIFRFESASGISNGMLRARLALLKKHGIIGQDVTVYGIKTGEYGSNAPAILAKVRDNTDWIELTKWFEEKRAALLPTDDIAALLADSDQNEKSPMVASDTVQAALFKGTLLGDYLDKKAFVAAQAAKAEEYESILTDYETLGGSRGVSAGTPTYDMQAEWDKVVAAYPMLAKFSTYASYGWDSDDLKLAADYVALCDLVGVSPQQETALVA